MRFRGIDILQHFSLVHLYFECTFKDFIALTSGIKCYVGEYQLESVTSFTISVAILLMQNIDAHTKLLVLNALTGVCGNIGNTCPVALLLLCYEIGLRMKIIEKFSLILKVIMHSVMKRTSTGLQEKNGSPQIPF